MSDRSGCIVNVALDGREQYVKGQARLLESCALHEPETPTLFWTNKVPPGSPLHREVSHAFKVFAMQEALRRYERAIWCDASVVLQRPLTYVWHCLRNEGYFFINNSGNPEVAWTSEPQLNAVGCTVMEAEKFDMCRSGVFGLSRKNLGILSEMEALVWKKGGVAFNGMDVSSSPHFRECRHDQAVLSYLIHKWRLYKHPGRLAHYTGEDEWDMAFFEFRGMSRA